VTPRKPRRIRDTRTGEKQQVYQFLTRHPYTAFSSDELRDRLGVTHVHPLYMKTTFTPYTYHQKRDDGRTWHYVTPSYPYWIGWVIGALVIGLFVAPRVEAALHAVRFLPRVGAALVGGVAGGLPLVTVYWFYDLLFRRRRGT